MTKQYSFLVLTDHRVHRAGNPVYHLLPELAKHPQCAFIELASRGNASNRSFFEQKSDQPLQVARIGEVFHFDPEGAWFINQTRPSNIQDYDVVLMRLPRPIEEGFLKFVAQAAPNAVFINDPLGIEKTSNKSYLLNFPDCAPPMKLCSSIEEILEFNRQFPIVLKPLEEYGGRGLVKIEGQEVFEGNERGELNDFLERQKEYILKHGYLAMKYLENVQQGDKRILVVGGEVLGASLRLPAKDSWLCNVAQGGTSTFAEVEKEEVRIIETIAPTLKEEGILIFGADTLVGDDGKRVLSEINTLSVGGFKNLEEQSEKPILQITAKKIIEYVNTKS